MEKFHVILIVGTVKFEYTQESESSEKLLGELNLTWEDQKKNNSIWQINDSLLDPHEIKMIAIKNISTEENNSESNEKTPS